MLNDRGFSLSRNHLNCNFSHSKFYLLFQAGKFISEKDYGTHETIYHGLENVYCANVWGHKEKVHSFENRVLDEQS